MPTFNGDIQLSNLIWAVPTALAFIALIQIVFVLFLTATGNIEHMPSRPNRPVMPQIPQSWSSDGLGSLPAALAGGGLPSITGGVGRDSAAGRFVVLAGLANTKEITLPGTEFGIGRFHNPEHGITMAIDEKSISRQHAAFTADEALREYYLMDTNSTYGTFLMKGGQFEQLPASSQVRVYNEDVVQFGSKVRVRLVLPSETREEAIR